MPSKSMKTHSKDHKGFQMTGIVPPSFCVPPGFNWKSTSSIIVLLSVTKKLHDFH